MKSAFYLVGILLLIGTVVGVKWAMEGGAANGRPKKNIEDLTKPPEYVVAWGHFDVAAGVTPLSAKLPGDVLDIVTESAPVKKGDVLLQLDDAHAKLTVDLAAADVRAGERLLDEAKFLPQQYQLQIEGQEAVLRALDNEIKKTALDRDSKVQLITDPPLKKTLEAMFAEGLQQLAEKKNAENAKLKAIKLQDAKLKIAQAEADLSAKKTRLTQAKEMLKHYQIVAPSDGEVLRTHVRKWETLGPIPRSHAIDFLPKSDVIVRAEVLQEWGRFVKEGLTVKIEDDTYHGEQWDGIVKTMSNWYAPTRTPVIEPFRYNDVRTLECIINVTGGEAKRLIGQRVRAKIKV